MSDGIRWIGEHNLAARTPGLPGMREAVSLTVARDISAREFLISLGAHAEDLNKGTLFKDQKKKSTATFHSLAMYGTCGGWVYVLENSPDATWYTKSLAHQESQVLTGAEIVCVTQREDDPPPYVSHVTPEGHASHAEWGAPTGHPDFDEALRSAGAIYPSLPDSSEEVVETYWEEHMDDLLPRIFTAVGNYCKLEISQTEVEAGSLPLVVFPPAS
ncbi:hypothetical protein GCM10007079_08890 [Nocardiopsis terrae]|uniref:Uncharacterized protein n=1 Tax=Nocardiopsis terrae TaxID=372655 RepID=A0ABR9HD17_9ACTN|nr:hypothetical protein [Nocardiopsis terrae]MBE1456894.1 hypothetical protein [Nocardiopsis terrae]GHC74552.1 hypothetical protein GCM10007079_08890 [Nocardiopsis terrae]